MRPSRVRLWFAGLDDSTTVTISRVVIAAAVILWLAVVIPTATRHEFWRDEVRALSLARAAGSPLDLYRLTQHDGHPVLWFLLALGDIRLQALKAADVKRYYMDRRASTFSAGLTPPKEGALPKNSPCSATTRFVAFTRDTTLAVPAWDGFATATADAKVWRWAVVYPPAENGMRYRFPWTETSPDSYTVRVEISKDGKTFEPVFEARQTSFERRRTPHYGAGCQRGDQLVGGFEAARSQRRRNHRFESFQFHRRICARVHLGRLHVGVAEPEGDLAQVLGGLQHGRGARVRRTCGETCLLESEGQDLLAVRTCLARMYSKPTSNRIYHPRERRFSRTV